MWAQISMYHQEKIAPVKIRREKRFETTCKENGTPKRHPFHFASHGSKTEVTNFTLRCLRQTSVMGNKTKN